MSESSKDKLIADLTVDLRKQRRELRDIVKARGNYIRELEKKLNRALDERFVIDLPLFGQG